jgi:hypothetical protein
MSVPNCISGVIIWWPRTGKWRRALSVKWRGGNFRLNYDIHKVLGLYFLPVLLVLAISGIEIVWHEPFEKVVATVLPVDHRPDPASSASGSPLTMDEAAERAQAVFPESRIARLYVPATPEDVWRVTSCIRKSCGTNMAPALSIWISTAAQCWTCGIPANCQPAALYWNGCFPSTTAMPWA